MGVVGARRRIAVIGGGVSGLTAAHVLRRSCDITLYEADDRLGGHAHTHDLGAHRVDSGFIVHNERTYPQLVRLFRELGVTTQDAEMSMSVSCRGCGLEYAGARGPAGLFARPGSLVRPAYLRMLAEIPRFHRRARALLAGPDSGRTLAEFLRAGRFSPYFVRHFAIPLVSAVWSCGPPAAGGYPARYLFAFLANHGMLSVTGAPQWKTVTGGSRGYVERVAKGLGAVLTATPVRALRRLATGVEVRDGDGGARHFDGAVVATHPGQALRLLADPTPAEREVLGAFTYSRNATVLHTDESVLPRARAARASWNYAMASCDAAGRAHVSYDLTRLQRLDAGPYLVTLNGDVPDEHVITRMAYEHPVFTRASVAAQRRLPALNDGTVAYAGAYHGWGFHEDGCRSGVEAARSLGERW
ncbi:NAD(P)/FAD-dependent oxidoreductase [Actinomadura scrupuli]|uniref:NAD(P)/FAD-dependent oxidoreductase n=1 Tax=Actinomadura scrupuli TaxID=559629 RepID=UPI003D961C60